MHSQARGLLGGWGTLLLSPLTSLQVTVCVLRRPGDQLTASGQDGGWETALSNSIEEGLPSAHGT